jgi:hypothetical protein
MKSDDQAPARTDPVARGLGMELAEGQDFSQSISAGVFVRHGGHQRW